MTDPSPKNSNPLPGNGLLGWLGRQIAHVKKAIHTDVQAPKTVYRNSQTHEQPLPQDPKVKLRRTIIDEVVVDPQPPPDAKSQQK